MHDASEYNFYKVVEDEEGQTPASGAGAANPGAISLVVSGVPNTDAGINSEYVSQVIKLQKERQRKFKGAGRLKDDAGTGTLTFIDSKILPKKIDYWPHLLSSWGITIRCDLWSDAHHACPKRAFTGATFADAAIETVIPDSRFRFSNMRLTTIEIVPSLEFQKALLDLQMAKGYFV